MARFLHKPFFGAFERALEGDMVSTAGLEVGSAQFELRGVFRRRGPSVEELLQDGPFEPLQATVVLRDLAVTVAELHRNGIVHGKLSGRAVVVTPGARARLIDPARLNGRHADAAQALSVLGGQASNPFQRDVRALGALLCRMLTGSCDPHQLEGAPADLARVCRRALGLDGRGYASADALARSLRFCLLRRRLHLV